LRKCLFANADYRMVNETDAITVKSLNKTGLNRTVDLDGRYIRKEGISPIVNDVMAAYAITRFAGMPESRDFAKAARWEFDIQPAGMHEGIGRLQPVTRVDVFFGNDSPDCSYLVTNDLESVFRIYPGPPLSLIDKNGGAG